MRTGEKRWIRSRGNVSLLSSESDRDSAFPYTCRIDDERRLVLILWSRFTPTWVQQLLRAFAYGTQFTASFLVYVLSLSHPIITLYYGIDVLLSGRRRLYGISLADNVGCSLECTSTDTSSLQSSSDTLSVTLPLLGIQEPELRSTPGPGTVASPLGRVHMACLLLM